MNTATFTIQTPAAAAPHGSPVAGIAAAWRLLRNLSGGRAAPRAARLPQRAAKTARTVALRCNDGDTLTVHVSGSGRPIVLVHGMGGSHQEWARTAALLAREACVYRFDLRGHGERAAGTPSGTDLPRMAADLALLIERLALQQPVLVGHSMGALAVMQYLRDHGAERIAGVCFIDQSPRITIDADWTLGMFGDLSGPQLSGFIDRLRGNFADTVIDEIVSRVSPRIAAACRQHRWLAGLLRRTLSSLSERSLIGMLQSLVDCDFRATLQALNVPALVVLGGRSGHYGGLPLAEYYHHTVAQATVRTYAQADHSPHLCEPARFVTDLLQFAAVRCPLEPQIARGQALG